MSKWQDVFNYAPKFFEGLGITIETTVYSLILALGIGVIIAIFRVTPSKLLNTLGLAYVEFFQNTPLIIQVFFFYYGAPVLGLNISGFACGTLGLAIYTGAYIAEVFRAGIQAIPRGQMEAARSSGMTYLQAMGYIILPQAFKVILPPLANQMVNMVKNTAILSTIATPDLMYQAYLISADTFIVFEVFIFAALLYLSLTVPLSSYVNYLEKRLQRSS